MQKKIELFFDDELTPNYSRFILLIRQTILICPFVFNLTSEQ
jgi:hypothetical protein